MKRISTIITFILCSIIVMAQEIYEVQKKETVYSISQKFGITIEQLLDANPSISPNDYKVKKGMLLNIPAKETIKYEGLHTVRIGVMLPLHDNDGDGQRMLEYYRGILMALDALKKQGVSAIVHAWNVAKDTNISQVLLNDGADKCDIIFGPLYSHQTAALGHFCNTYGIKMVIPFSIDGNEAQTNANVFQIYQAPELFDKHTIDAMLMQFPKAHFVIIDCNDPSSTKGNYTKQLRARLEQQKKAYSITSLSSLDIDFAKAFRSNKVNVVILNTGSSPQLNSAMARLNALTDANQKLNITMYGYTEWLMYTKNFGQLFHKYNTFIPTYFYHNEYSHDTATFTTAYQEWFKTDMLQALPRFAITGFDHCNYFVNALRKYGKAFDGTQPVAEYIPLQTPLKFERINGGGLQCSSFMLLNYKPTGEILSISY